MARGRDGVARLVVKEKIGLELAQERALFKPSEEHGLVNGQVPFHQRVDRALMGGRAARRDERGAQPHARHIGLLLQTVQRSQQRLERSPRQRQCRLAQLVGLERRKPF